MPKQKPIIEMKVPLTYREVALPEAELLEGLPPPADGKPLSIKIVDTAMWAGATDIWRLPEPRPQLLIDRHRLFFNDIGEAIGAPMLMVRYTPGLINKTVVKIPNLRLAMFKQAKLRDPKPIADDEHIRIIISSAEGDQSGRLVALFRDEFIVHTPWLPGLTGDETANFFNIYLSVGHLYARDLSAHEKMDIAKS